MVFNYANTLTDPANIDSLRFYMDHLETFHTCKDPESYFGGGHTLNSDNVSRYHFLLFCKLMRGGRINTTISGPSFACGPMMANIECLLGSFMNFWVIWTSIAKKPYIFVIFQWGPDSLSRPSGSTHV